VLRLVGEHLGRHQRADLAERVGIGQVAGKDARRAERKKKLTAVSSSRWAGAMTRASEDQYQLAMRCLFDERASLRRAIGTISRRLAVSCGRRSKSGARGYADQSERAHKQRRLHLLQARLAVVEQQIASGRPSITVGGRRLARQRHHLADAQLTEAQWRRWWEAARLFLTADGESGAPHGNYTIAVDPGEGTVSIVLPEPLRHLANEPRGRYRLGCTVTFHHRRGEWLDRVTAHRAVRYDITCDPARDRWYLDASWSADTTVPPTPHEFTALGTRLLGVDLNADHLAACVFDAHGNPIGAALSIPLHLTGPTAARDGRLRAAISALITSPASRAAPQSPSRTWASLTPAGPGGRPWAAGGAGRRSAAPWPVSPPPASANGCAAWRITPGWWWSRWTRPTPAAGVASTGPHPCKTSPRKPRRPRSPGTTQLRWPSDGAPSGTGSGVGQV
jgi:hypothetical protein